MFKIKVINMFADKQYFRLFFLKMILKIRIWFYRNQNSDKIKKRHKG